MMENSPSRVIFIAIGFILALFIILFVIPFKTVPYETMETYYETGVKQEPYIAKEPYIVREPINKQETIFNDRPYSVPNGTNVPVVITQSDAELIGHFELPGSGGIRINLPSNKIFYEQLGQSGDFQIPLPKGTYTVILRDSMVWGKPIFLSLIVKWTEVGDVTKYREVTENRDVPAQIEKQRPTTKYKKASLWELIFGINPSNTDNR